MRPICMCVLWVMILIDVAHDSCPEVLADTPLVHELLNLTHVSAVRKPTVMRDDAGDIFHFRECPSREGYP